MPVSYFENTESKQFPVKGPFPVLFPLRHHKSWGGVDSGLEWWMSTTQQSDHSIMLIILKAFKFVPVSI